jgi:hypothetical protein
LSASAHVVAHDFLLLWGSTWRFCNKTSLPRDWRTNKRFQELACHHDPNIIPFPACEALCAEYADLLGWV